MKNFKICIIILNWNGLDDTLECLDSVKKIDYPNFNVIVVDNGSTDNSVEVIKKRFSEVTLIATGKNLGFAEGNNVGMRYAMSKGTDYILLLNNDTTVDARLLSSLVEAAEQNLDAGIFGAKIYYYSEPDKIWYAGATWNRESSYFHIIGTGEIDNGSAFESIYETDYACGCALFVRTEVIYKVGLMDPKYFLTYEESDWCYKARKAGFKVLFAPQAKVWHKVSSSFGGARSPLQQYFYTRNILLWGGRNLPLSEHWRLLRKTFKDVFRLECGRKESGWIGKRLYWTFRACRTRIWGGKADPVIRAKYMGFRDYIFRHFGNCPDEVRALNKTC